MKNLIAKTLGLYLDVLSLLSPTLASRAGFKLFCRPFRVSVNNKQMAFFQSAEKFTFDHEGQSVQGYRWGTGEKKILFLHGWQSHTYRWKAYIEALPKDQFTIYSLDAPGHGLSSGNFLTVPLYSSLIENFVRKHNEVHTVVGHSLGGFSLLYTHYRVPNLSIDRIILLAPPGEARDFISVFQKTLGISDRTVKLVIDHFASRYQVTPDFFSSLKFASHLNVKGLIIHDEDDPEAPYSYSIPLHKLWTQSRLVTTRGLGHNLKSSSVVKEVVGFIQEPTHEHVLPDISVRSL
jgi:pimeloyl-ACP methyl ester carboxylesterase